MLKKLNRPRESANHRPAKPQNLPTHVIDIWHSTPVARKALLTPAPLFPPTEPVTPASGDPVLHLKALSQNFLVTKPSLVA